MHFETANDLKQAIVDIHKMLWSVNKGRSCTKIGGQCPTRTRESFEADHEKRRTVCFKCALAGYPKSGLAATASGSNDSPPGHRITVLPRTCTTRKAESEYGLA